MDSAAPSHSGLSPKRVLLYQLKMRPIISFLAADLPAANLSSLFVQLVSVVIWPIVLITSLLTHRKALNRLVLALAALAESANKIKVWQVEIERDIDSEVGKAAEAAQVKPSVKAEIAQNEIVAAAKVDVLVGKLTDSTSKNLIVDSVRLRMLGLAKEYDELRARMPSSESRTVEMSRVAAQMRALGLVAKPWLRQFSTELGSAGVRLAAIAILQMSPNLRYVDWLGERFKSEQPFMFYQSAIALMEAVRKFGAKHNQELSAVITLALEQLKGFEGGPPDQHSISVLDAALNRLRQLANRNDV